MFIGTTNLFNGMTEKNEMIIFHIVRIAYWYGDTKYIEKFWYNN